MGLSCSCDYEPEPGDVVFYSPSDFSVYSGKRSTHCCSCWARIRPGDTVAKFTRFKIPTHDVEVKIHGEDGEIPRAPHYHCEQCGGLYMALEELGFCIHCDENMVALVREYARDFGPQRKEAA